MTAVVLAREGGQYRVQLDGAERVAVLRGTARRGTDRAVAGDRVSIDPATVADDVLGIQSVLERHSLLARRTPEGRGKRPVAANVDQVVVVTAARDPAPVLQLVDRLILVAEVNSVPAVVVVNKVDLAPADPVLEHLSAAGYPVLETSVTGGVGMAELRELLSGRESVFAGPSGVGKSSLLNSISPGLGLRVGEISEKVRRGRHTTTSATMVAIGDGGFVVDTPGFSEVGVWGVSIDALRRMYPEFVPHDGRCKFSDCSHRTEPGCLVLADVEAGDIPASRHEGYLAMWQELDSLPREWE